MSVAKVLWASGASVATAITKAKPVFHGYRKHSTFQVWYRHAGKSTLPPLKISTQNDVKKIPGFSGQWMDPKQIQDGLMNETKSRILVPLSADQTSQGFNYSATAKCIQCHINDTMIQ